MPSLPPFRIEAHFSKWEFKARHHLTAGDAESMTIGELLALNGETTQSLEGMRLGYTETWGAPELRALIARTYDTRAASDIVCFAGVEEALYAAMHVLLSADDHAIVVTPNYQALETIPLSLCACTGVSLDPEQNWSLDIDDVARAIRPNTRLVVINFPHNPTGKILEQERFDALVALCRRHGIWVLSDEVYRPAGPVQARHLPQVADVYERGISVSGLSKAYGLPGLRTGWIATPDPALLRQLEAFKHYLSISNAAPAEHLAAQAFRARDAILARNCGLISQNLSLLRAFFSRRAELFEWYEPDGGCVAYPRYLGPDGVESFAARILDEAGILVMPASIFRSDLTPTPDDRFRIGFGRAAMRDGLDALRDHLELSTP